MPLPTDTAAAPWFDTLTSSVYALGAAARECRTAHQTARAATWNLDPYRLMPVEGAVNIPGQYFVRPHDDAVGKLSDAYATLTGHTRKLYENTALAYAYGTAAVLEAVLNGDHPTHVILSRVNGLYTRPNALLPDLTASALSVWRDCRRLDLLRQDVTARECAAATVEAWNFYEDLADGPLTSEVTDAEALAAGLADTALAYGETAESALHYALTKPRNNGLDAPDGAA
jgi:hypothetical protein